MRCHALLCVPGLGQVGYQRHDHPHVHPRSNGDGKRRQEQRSPGAHSRPGEVSLGDGLACLEETKRRGKPAYSSAASATSRRQATVKREKTRNALWEPLVAMAIRSLPI